MSSSNSWRWRSPRRHRGRILLFLVACILISLYKLQDSAPSSIINIGTPAIGSGSQPLNQTALDIAPAYVSAIMEPRLSNLFSMLECPEPDKDRYTYLYTSSEHKFFFALNLRNSISILPRLLSSIIEAVEFLGPHKCVLSIVEGHSHDGTYEILHALRKSLSHLGLEYHLVRSSIDSHTGDRIAQLAALRNLALTPLLERPGTLDSTTVLFLNDIAFCAEDILELTHQLIYQHASMTCGMDWTFVGPTPTFYDVWIARDMRGETFFHIPLDGSWEYANELFPANARAREDLESGTPFQVFSCWNGGVAIRGDVLRRVRFRGPSPGECVQGEPTLFAKDLWAAGLGRIAVVPSVNVEYSDYWARKVKGSKGFVSRWLMVDEGERIVWDDQPPEKVRCCPGYENQVMLPWNDGLGENGALLG